MHVILIRFSGTAVNDAGVPAASPLCALRLVDQLLLPNSIEGDTVAYVAVEGNQLLFLCVD